MQTRRVKRRNQYTRKSHIQHHHFLLRMETTDCPSIADKGKAYTLLDQIVRDLNMKILGSPHVYYVTNSHENEGLTALASIQTSHIAYHFWKNPERRILHHPESKCLLQMDVYTCGSLTLKHIQSLLRHLTQFGPTHVNATLLNRNYSLTLERQLLWRNDSGKKWSEWVSNITSM